MKKIFFILSAAVVMATTACTRESALEQKSVLTTTVAPQDGDMARVTFSITVPQTDLYATLTRAQHQMGEQPAIANGDLYVAVFGAGNEKLGGRLQNFLKADLKATISHDLTDEADNTKTYTYEYEVLMPLSNEGLTLDFLVGACDAQGNLYTLENPLPSTVIKEGEPADAYEADVMPLLHAVNGYAAYWQRKQIDGVFPHELSDGTYEMTQYVDDEGNPLSVHDQDYVADNIPELDNVQLVRNFAKITYTAADDAPFTLNGFCLVDAPKTGAVAPYSTAEGYNTIYTTASNSGAVLGSYQGYVLSHELKGEPSTFAFKTPGEQFDYMYERTIPTNSDPAFAESGAILWVTWKNISSVPQALRNQQRYYKVAFVDENGYIPILRNIQYDFQVSDIQSEAHPTSASAAYKGQWLGDVSANVSTAMLDDISNNKSRIVIAGEGGKSMSYTAIGNGVEIPVDFYFYPVASGSEVVVTNGKQSTLAGATVTITTSILTDGDHPQAIADISPVVVTRNGNNDQYGTVTVMLEDSETGVVKKGKLRILGQVEGYRALYREVSFTVMEKQNFAAGSLTASATPLASDAMNQTTTVTIVLPDELPRDIFPLQIMIEAANNGLTSIPDNTVTPAISALPVKYGPSAFNSSKNSYYFVKTITFDEYATLNGTSYEYTNEFPCKFKTRLSSGNATTIKINDINKEYFNESTISLTVN